MRAEQSADQESEALVRPEPSRHNQLETEEEEKKHMHGNMLAPVEDKEPEETKNEVEMGRRRKSQSVGGLASPMAALDRLLGNQKRNRIMAGAERWLR